LYAANLFAAYEVAIYRVQSVATVCGLAAVPFFGVLSPIIYLAMPGKPRKEAMEPVASAPTAAIPIGSNPPPTAVGEPTAPPSRSSLTAEEASEAAAAAPETATAEPATNLPQPIVFARGEFMFNRRFFETKFAGFFRAIPTEAEKDLVLLIKSSRGEFVGRHISRTTQTEFYLQVFKNSATADEMIPFNEVFEVQIRHKDSL